jgi:hypothetical protein
MGIGKIILNIYSHGFGGTDIASTLHSEPVYTAFFDAVVAEKVSGPQLMLQ